jgi:predicted dehydrogenase
VAIIGAGLMGRWHAAAAARVGADVTLVIDPDDGRATRLAHRYGATVTDLTAVHGEVVDVAHICSPLATHAAITRRVLSGGVAALVEKPLAATARETDDLLALAESRGIALCPVHQFLFQPGTRRLLGALDRLGTVLHLDYEACSAGGMGQSPAGLAEIVADILPHPLSLARRVVRQPLHTLSWHVARPSAGEFRATAHTVDATIGLLISMGGRPTRNTLRLIGTRGTAHLDLFHGFATFEPGAVSRGRKITRPLTHAAATITGAAANLIRRAVARELAYPGLATLVKEFYEASRGERAVPIAADEIRDVALARDRLLGSGDHA